MSNPDKHEADETAFNETLKRMLKTPPKPHDKESHGTNQRGARKNDKRVTEDDDTGTSGS